MAPNGSRRPAPRRTIPARTVAAAAQDREGGGEDGARAEQDDDRGPVLGVPQRLHEPPGDAGDDTDEEGQVRPRQVGVDERAGGPEADESGLVGRDLQRLGRLEDDSTGAEGGEEPCGADQRRRGTARGERLTAHEEDQPQGRHGGEARQRRERVEVGGDQPDEPDPDEAAAEVEQDAPHADAGVVLGAVARRDARGLLLADEALRGPVGDLVAQPGELLRRDRSGREGG
jgi:hypothetical protein